MIMKCKDCSYTDCPCRSSDAQKECEFQNRIIKVPNEWQGVRIQAAISAMQGMLSCGTGAFSYQGVTDEIAKAAVDYADSLIERLKKTL